MKDVTTRYVLSAIMALNFLDYLLWSVGFYHTQDGVLFYFNVLSRLVTTTIWVTFMVRFGVR